jgi:D-alanine-D-alanine ligase
MSGLRIAVLMGGESAEAEVSRNSAHQVAQALSESGHESLLVELDSVCAQTLIGMQPDAVFPALHGPPGEDGTVQGFLEMLDLPYVGSGVKGSALAMDKALAKRLFAEHGLPVAPSVVIAQSTQHLGDEIQRVIREIGRSVVIKPLSQGSAIGVTPLPNGGDLDAAIKDALSYGDCLVESYVMGKEITVGVLEVADELVAHPVIEIVTATDAWYDYESRYTVGKSEHLIPAVLPVDVGKLLQDIAMRAHRCLGLRDLSRADYIVTEANEIVLLEVNTLPGMTPTSLYPEGAQHLGYEFTDLVDLLVRQAAARG